MAFIGDHVTLEEVDTGRIIDVLPGYRVEPLGFDDMLLLSKSPTLPVRIRLRNARLNDRAKQFSPDQIMDVELPFESHSAAKAYALVPGGWLPPAWLSRRSLLLLDRNMVTEIRNRFDSGSVRQGREPDFLNDLVSRQVEINPFPFAMEGNRRRPPTPEEVEVGVIEAAKHIREALPNARVQPSFENAVSGARSFVEDGQRSFESRIRFLMGSVPILIGKGARSNRLATWTAILRKADETGLSRTSLPVLCVLSALVCGQGKERNPGWGILKPQTSYGEPEAYNVHFDLRALELLIHLTTQYERRSFAFCTKDRPLALFWCGLSASNFRSEGSTNVTDFPVTAPLFPDLSPEELATLPPAQPRRRLGTPRPTR